LKGYRPDETPACRVYCRCQRRAFTRNRVRNRFLALQFLAGRCDTDEGVQFRGMADTYVSDIEAGLQRLIAQRAPGFSSPPRARCF
jgi:hypothetical protein